MNKKRPTWQEKVKDLFGEINEWGYCDCESCNDKIQKIKDFIQTLLSQQRKEIVEWSKELIRKHNARILNEFQKQGTADMPFIAYDERICLIPAITIAMKETDDDIITKLSE